MIRNVTSLHQSSVASSEQVKLLNIAIVSRIDIVQK